MPHFRLIDIESHRRVPYQAKDFDEQEGFKFSLVTVSPNETFVVEVGAYLHWIEKRPRDVAVDVSCMSGCTENCRFCAAARLSTKCHVLNAEQMTEQVQVALDHIRAARSEFLQDLDQPPLVTISFAGMGEPVKNAAEVMKAIDMIRHHLGGGYRLQFIVSTVAVWPHKIDAFAKVSPPLQSLQVSLHGANSDVRNTLLGKKSPLQPIVRALDNFASVSPTTEVKINYLLVAGINDSPEQATELAQLLGERPFYVKISSMNETGASRAAGLRPPPASTKRAFISAFNRARPAQLRQYTYGSESPLKMSCGQLASYADTGLDVETKKQIAQIFKEISRGNAVLFLGAGANLPVAPDSQHLARMIFPLLELGAQDNDSGLDLGSLADLVQAKKRGGEMRDLVKSRLETIEPPEAIAKLATFPWHSVFTTNYDTFFERAAEQMEDAARQTRSGRSIKHIKPVRSNEELIGSIPRGVTPLIKLHGCLMANVGDLVLSDNDYIDRYEEHRELLFKYLEVEVSRRCVVFLGYSMRDYYIKSLVFDSRTRQGKMSTPAYVVSRPDAFSGLRAKHYDVDLKADLVSATADQFAEELYRLNRQPVIMISGSARSDLRQTSEDGTPGLIMRDDASEQLGELARYLAAGLSEMGISVINGGSAPDKFGQIVARNMPIDLVETYVATVVPRLVDAGSGDDLGQVVGSVSILGGPADVIDAMTDSAHLAVIAGGSAITLREYNAASSKGRVVLPVALGDPRYTSDLIHSFFEGNLTMLEQMEDDPGYVNKVGMFTSAPGILSRQRLENLKLHAHGAKVVADTILDVLRDLRMRLA